MIWTNNSDSRGTPFPFAFIQHTHLQSRNVQPVLLIALHECLADTVGQKGRLLGCYDVHMGHTPTSKCTLRWSWRKP